ncbi:MAG: PAS domain S-box protein, partial [Planctomycetes bacterium]|nr:PAS domain S-box protein [Planctomycetota bacterium]
MSNAESRDPAAGAPAASDPSLLLGVVEAAPDGILVVDVDGTIVVANSQLARLFGYAQRELIGRCVDELVPGRLRAEHPAHRARYAATRRSRALAEGQVLWGRRRDGSEVPVE